MTALKHFLADQHDRQQATKRGGGFQFLALTPALVSAIKRGDAAAVDEFSPPTRAAMLSLGQDLAG